MHVSCSTDIGSERTDKMHKMMYCYKNQSVLCCKCCSDILGVGLTKTVCGKTNKHYMLYIVHASVVCVLVFSKINKCGSFLFKVLKKK